jgi:hypothetical protein
MRGESEGSALSTTTPKGAGAEQREAMRSVRGD